MMAVSFAGGTDIVGPSCDTGTVSTVGTPDSRPIQEVMNDHASALMRTPGVVGVGIGQCSDRPCIKVFVVEKTPALVASVPSTLDGYDVVIEATGDFRAR
jgi:hypothetical protein